MIEVICGPMFSGKTEELIRRVNRFTYANIRFLLFKPEIDKRYSKAEVVSHNDCSINSLVVNSSHDIIPFMNGNPNHRIIAIDEAQFFDEELVDICKKYDMNHHFILAGLDMDANGNPFPIMEKLLPMADHVKKLSAVCMKCGKDAKMSYKKNKNTSVVDVGGSEKYEARCINCWSV